MSRVKCLKDGELPSGRKGRDALAVWHSHPAAEKHYRGNTSLSFGIDGDRRYFLLWKEKNSEYYALPR